MPSKVDLYLIIEETAKDKLKNLPYQQVKILALAIFNIIGYVNQVLSLKYFAL